MESCIEKTTKLHAPTRFLPYGRQSISQADIDAVVSVLQSDYLTQGPTIELFEQKLAATVGARHAIVCSNGTAALHLAMMALDLGPGATVVTTANTFVASANCARYVGAEVTFCDIDPHTGLLDVDQLEMMLSRDKGHKIKAIIPVHFAGQPIDLSRISDLARTHGAYVVDDACHALGASYMDHGRPRTIGDNSHSDLTVFSFHPVKHVATGEGGAVTTSDPMLAARLRQLRSHGITKTEFLQSDLAFSDQGVLNPWYYEMSELGYNYRLTDIQAALGISQLARLQQSVVRRNEIAAHYNRLLAATFSRECVRLLDCRERRTHAYHLYTICIDFAAYGRTRATVMNALKAKSIGTQVHYIPVPLQPYYHERYRVKPGDFPMVESYYAQALSLPMYPDLSDDDILYVVASLESVLLGR
jgi:UDP-4-amino-4,6-dideoxy-N-acetyl-beta-L-altrosamine transaminase